MIKHIKIETDSDGFDLYQAVLQISVALKFGARSGHLDDGSTWNITTEGTE